MDCKQINECIIKIQSEGEFHIMYVRKGEYSTLLLAPILTYIHGVFQRTTHVIHVIYVINDIYDINEINDINEKNDIKDISHMTCILSLIYLIN